MKDMAAHLKRGISRQFSTGSVRRSSRLSFRRQSSLDPQRHHHMRFSLGRQSSLDPIRQSSVDEELLTVPENLDATMQLLFMACHGDVKGVQDLLNEGVNVNSIDLDGRTALHIAACEGQVEVVKLLLSRKANIDARDRWGSTVRYILENCKDDMDFFNTWIDKGIVNRLSDVAEKDFIQLNYTDAVKWGCDLQSEHERFITEEAFGGCPVIIRDYPKDIKIFYMRQNDDGKTVAAMDMLVPRIGELIGGSQREEWLEYLEERLDEMKLNRESYWWYLDLRRYGSVPHAGFGLGFERLIQFATGIDNIRDAIPFPRAPCSPEF